MNERIRFFYELIAPPYRFAKSLFLRAKYALLCRSGTHIDSFLSGSENRELFVTHDLGGGTSFYNRALFARPDAPHFIEFRPISYRQGICFLLRDVKSGEQLFLKRKDFGRVFSHRFRGITVNSLVSCYDATNILRHLAKYKNENPGVRLSYNVHDFHCVCPRYNLVAGEWFCNLECETHRCAFDSVLDFYGGTVKEWREAWGSFLAATDEVVCFSASSKEILCRAYPSLDAKKIAVKPHDMSGCTFRPSANFQNPSPRIAFVGAVDSVPKGLRVVQKLLAELPESVPVSLIGPRKSVYMGGGTARTYALSASICATNCRGFFPAKGLRSPFFLPCGRKHSAIWCRS